MCGVAISRWPYTPTSPMPRSSASNTTMFGASVDALVCGRAADDPPSDGDPQPTTVAAISRGMGKRRMNSSARSQMARQRDSARDVMVRHKLSPNHLVRRPYVTLASRSVLTVISGDSLHQVHSFCGNVQNAPRGVGGVDRGCYAEQRGRLARPNGGARAVAVLLSAADSHSTGLLTMPDTGRATWCAATARPSAGWCGWRPRAYWK